MYNLFFSTVLKAISVLCIQIALRVQYLGHLLLY